MDNATQNKYLLLQSLKAFSEHASQKLSAPTVEALNTLIDRFNAGDELTDAECEALAAMVDRDRFSITQH
jgi:hypothetical protein